MSPLALLLWSMTVMVDACGQLSLKQAAASAAGLNGLAHWKHMAQRPWMWIGIGSYVMEFVLWLAFLALVPLSIAVMLRTINIVVILIAGHVLLGDPLRRWRLAGVGLITLGVAVVGMAG